MSKIIRNGRVVSQTGYYKDLEDKPTINGHILEEINNTSKNLDIFVTIPKAEYEDPTFEPNVQTLYAVIDEDENVRVHFFNQNEDEPEEYILHDYREVEKIPNIGDETVLYYLNKTYRDEDDEDKLYRSGLWGYVCLNREEEEEEKEYEWRNFSETKVDDYTIHNYENIATQVGGYLMDSFETEEVVLLKDVIPTSVESDGEKTTLHCGWTSEYLPYTVNTNYKVSIRYAGEGMPVFLEGEKTQRTTLPDILVPGVGNIHLQYPEVTVILDAATCPSTEIESYKVNIIWDRPKQEFISRINPLFIPHDDTIRVNEKGELTVGGLNNAYAAINRVDDYLYDTYYSGLDYNYAEKHFKELNTTAGFCSLMRSGSFVGRNYDNKYSELCDFVVHTPNRVGRFATLGVASGLSDLTKQKVESGEHSDDYKILPFMLVDGINEKGVFAAYNVVPTDKALTTLTVPDIMEKKVMCALELVRFVVDNFETATAAVEYIRDYVGVYMIDQIQEEGYELHLMVADQENTYLVEFVDNRNVVQNMAANPYMTNFYQSDIIINPDRSVYTPADVAAGFLPSVENNITAHGSGLERYNTMAQAFNPLLPYTSVTEMRVLLNDLKYSNTYSGLSGTSPWGSEFVGINGITVDTPLATIQGDAEVLSIIDKFNNRSRDPEDPNYGTWHTLHSSVYDITNLMLNITSQEDSIEYIYNLPKLNEEDNEIRIGEISDTIID